jgi:hypothetical protein
VGPLGQPAQDVDEESVGLTNNQQNNRAPVGFDVWQPAETHSQHNCEDTVLF